MAFRFVISDPKTGKSFQKELDKSKVSNLIGSKLGDEFDGGILDVPGYKLRISGGSGKTGAPMKKGVSGSATKKLLLSQGIGFNSNVKGIKRRKLVRGTTIGTDVSQVNVVVVKHGKQTLENIFGSKDSSKENTEEKK